MPIPDRDDGAPTSAAGPSVSGGEVTPPRLDRPPSDRYRPIGDAAAPYGSTAGAAWGGLAAGLAGAAMFAVLAGGLSLDWGLLVVAALLGWEAAQGVRLGGGSRVTGAPRVRLALLFAFLALSGGEVGTWLIARAQGGVLPLLDLLWASYGPLVPLEYAAALLTAAISAR